LSFLPQKEVAIISNSNNEQPISELSEFFNDKKIMAKIRNAFTKLESSKKNHRFSCL
jgi:mannitol/fructose-specific phosphotransferase system IIA component (Ntr-type)